jgi:hypothetical protein
MIKMITIM